MLYWILAGVGLVSVGVLLVAGLLVRREDNRRRQLRRVLANRPVGPDGVIPGAHSISLTGDPRRGILILHGFGDTPQSVRTLAEAFHRAGWSVEAPLLPGHGRTLEALDRASARQWLEEARAAWLTVRSRHATCALAGQSMGGALAVLLAAEAPPVAMVLVAPLLSMTPALRRAARWAWAWGVVLPYVDTSDPRSIRDPEAAIASRAYGAATWRSIRELARTTRWAAAALPRVTAPTLLVQSPDDNRVSAAGAAAALAALGAADKQLVWRPGEGHVLLADRGRDQVAALALQWVARRAAAGDPTQSARGALNS
jgi:carboxylesterase